MEQNKTNKTIQDKFNQLRSKAEVLINGNIFLKDQINFEDPLKLIHELQTLHIELKLQNEELQLSEQKLIKSQKEYTELYDFSPTGYISLNLKGLILNANLTFANMLLIERSKIINQPLSAYIISQDQDIFYYHKRKISETAQVCELRMQKKNGDVFDVQLESILIFDKLGNPEQFRIIIIDISDRKASQKEKIKLESELQQARKMESVGMLSSGIAHEFNNILEFSHRSLFRYLIPCI